MKKFFKITSLFFIATLSILYFCWAKYYAAEFIEIKRAEKKWGVKPLNKKLFRNGDPKQRASMAVDIFKNQTYVGKNMLLVRQELGDPDSYFFSDTIYAYKIMPFPGKDKENWHLVFIPDDDLKKVKEVKIHKKCCYPSPF